MLRSDLCDYSDVYVAVKGDITLTKTNGKEIIDIRNRFLAFKNNAPFTNCISKINNVLIDNAEGLHIVMQMYNLLDYGKKYRKTTGSFWDYTEMNLIILLLTMMTPKILTYLNTKVVLQEKHQMQIKAPSKEIQILKEILKLFFH